MPWNFDDILPAEARDWPYDGERDVTFTNVTVELGLFYDRFDENGKGYFSRDSIENLPLGHTKRQQVQLVLNMEVDDPHLPEPLFPPTIVIGNATDPSDPSNRGNVEFTEDGRFRWLDKNGAPTAPSRQRAFTQFIQALIEYADWEPKVSVPTAPDFWFSVEDLNGVSVRMGIKSTKYEDSETGETKTSHKAWPVGRAGGGSSDSAPFDLRPIAAKAGNPSQFANMVVAAGAPSMVIQRVLNDREGEYIKAGGAPAPL